MSSDLKVSKSRGNPSVIIVLSDKGGIKQLWREAEVDIHIVDDDHVVTYGPDGKFGIVNVAGQTIDNLECVLECIP